LTARRPNNSEIGGGPNHGEAKHPRPRPERLAQGTEAVGHARYGPLSIGGLQEVDYRTKSFSCSRCGAEAYLAVIEPIKETGMEDYRVDVIERPERHPRTVERLIGDQHDPESPQDRAKRIAAQKAAIEKRRKAAEAAAADAVRRWDKAKPAGPTHPYLKKKGIKPNGLRQDGDILLVPVRDAEGKLHTLQTIPASGDPKLFGKGSAAAGHYFEIGDLANTPAICIGEGFATMARVHEMTGDACIVAFSDHMRCGRHDIEAGGVTTSPLFPDNAKPTCVRHRLTREEVCSVLALWQ
jgi:hypothetical protein